jgi:hypothetical protein
MNEYCKCAGVTEDQFKDTWSHAEDMGEVFAKAKL